MPLVTDWSVLPTRVTTTIATYTAADPSLIAEVYTYEPNRYQVVLRIRTRIVGLAYVPTPTGAIASLFDPTYTALSTYERAIREARAQIESARASVTVRENLGASSTQLIGTDPAGDIAGVALVDRADPLNYFLTIDNA